MILRKRLALPAMIIVMVALSPARAWLAISNPSAQDRTNIKQRNITPWVLDLDKRFDPRQQPLSPDQLRLQPGYQNRDDAWILSSPEFEHLSGASQTDLLRKYGLLEPLAADALTMPSRTAEGPADETQPPPSGNIKVNDPTQDIGNRTQSETCSATSGTNVVVGYNDTFSSNSNTAVSFSRDLGRTWAETHIPTYPLGRNTGDPVVAAGPNGEFYFATLAVNQYGIRSIGITRSDDGGAAWSPLVNVSIPVNRSQNDQDKEWLAVDTTNSPHRGNVYVSWTSLQMANIPILFVRSTDGGQTWSEPIRLSRPNTSSQGSFIAVGPDGEVYVTWYDFGTSFLRITRSTDGGATFSTATAVKPVNPVLAPLNGGFELIGGSFSIPSMAVDASNGPNRGHLYIVYHARGQGRDASDVFLVKSSNGGRTWSTPLRVNDDATDTDQWMPSVAVARNGTLAVMWYDRRNDPTNNSLMDVYMTTSTDDASTFAPNQRITTGNWLLTPTPVDLRFGYHGDYNQLSASDSQFIFNWGDDREGDANIFVGFAPITGRPSGPDFTISSKTLLQNVTAGQTANFTIGSLPVAGFNGSVSLNADPAYPGIGYNFSSPNLTTGNNAVLNVSTAATVKAATVKPGTYLITITGRSGGLAHTTNLRLTVYSGMGGQHPPTRVSNSREGAESPSIAIDPAGTIHVVWRELDRRRDPVQGSVRRAVFYSQRRTGTSTFSPPIPLSDPETTAFNTVFLVDLGPVIRVDPAGNINVMWTQVNPVSGFEDVYLSRSIDGGHGFSIPVNLSRTNDASKVGFFPAMAVDEAGSIYASWTRFDLDSGIMDVFVTRSTDGGRTFLDARNVSRTNSPTIAAFRSAVTVDRTGNIFLLWTQFDFAASSQDVFFSRSSNGGQTFSTSVNLSLSNNASIRVFGAILTADRAGKVYATWIKDDFDRGEEDLFFTASADGGQTFSPPVNVSRTNRLGGAVCGICTSSQVYLGPAALAITPTGQVAVAWTDSSTNNFEILSSRSSDGGKTFLVPVNVSVNIGISSSPSIAVGSDGRTAIAWNDDSDGIGNVFLSVSPMP